MMLLIKPLITVFAYILKLFVALGYVITGNFAMAPVDGGRPAQAAVVIQENGSATMTVTLDDGRRFRGPLLPCTSIGADASPLSIQPPEDFRHATSSATRAPLASPQRCSEVAAAFLLGAHGNPMKCVFVRRGETSVARCRTGNGRLFIGPLALTG